MIAAGIGCLPVALTGDAAAEFATPHDEGVFEEPSLFEVAEECGGRLIDVGAA